MKFLKQIPAWKKFPAVETLGYYAPLGNYIYLNNFANEDEFLEACKNPPAHRNAFSVFLHEYQHYLDQVSTLWGAKNIIKIFSAYSVQE